MYVLTCWVRREEKYAVAIADDAESRSKIVSLCGRRTGQGVERLPQDSFPVTRVKGRCGRVKHARRRTLLTCWSHFPRAEVMMANTNKIQDFPKKDRQSEKLWFCTAAIERNFTRINLRLWDFAGERFSGDAFGMDILSIGTIHRPQQ